MEPAVMPFARPIPDDGRVVVTLQKMAERWAPRSVLDVELLTVREVAGIFRTNVKNAYRIVHALPAGAIVRYGHGGGAANTRILVHAWALGQLLNLGICPGCGREWPDASSPGPR